jgi:hypothetical protein
MRLFFNGRRDSKKELLPLLRGGYRIALRAPIVSDCKTIV